MERIVIDRKEYMRSTYSKYWKNVRKNVYGFMDYDKAFINLIESFSNKHGKILEVAIGTGEPIANNLENIGYQVYGIDISDRLVDECKKNNKNINFKEQIFMMLNTAMRGGEVQILKWKPDKLDYGKPTFPYAHLNRDMKTATIYIV